MTTDQELAIAFFEAQDEQAYQAIVERHAGFVYRVARSIVRDDAQAEDATQETFVALLAGDIRYRELGSLRPWLG